MCDTPISRASGCIPCLMQKYFKYTRRLLTSTRANLLASTVLQKSKRCHIGQTIPQFTIRVPAAGIPLTVYDISGVHVVFSVLTIVGSSHDNGCTFWTRAVCGCLTSFNEVQRLRPMPLQVFVLKYSRIDVLFGFHERMSPKAWFR